MKCKHFEELATAQDIRDYISYWCIDHDSMEDEAEDMAFYSSLSLKELYKICRSVHKHHVDWWKDMGGELSLPPFEPDPYGCMM